MARISDKSKYPLDTKVSDDDYIIGTDYDNNNKTVNFNVGKLKEHILSEITGGGGDSQTDGIPNGDGTFTWVKYSQYSNGRVGGEDNGAASMSDYPLEVLPLYIGLAYNKPTAVESDNPDDYIWGDVADVQIDANGKYTWVKYADTPFSGMSDEPLGKAYIGLSFNNDSASESTDYNDYNWSKIIGNNGTDGIPIVGTTKYIWIKYSQYANGFDADGVASMVDDPTAETIYIGVSENRDTYIEGDDPTEYRWSLLSGDVLLANGLYLWVKYADTPTTGMSDSPIGKSYIGLAFNKTLPESEDPLSRVYSSYQWSKITADSDGNDNTIIDNNAAKYTWLKFSEYEDGFVTGTTVASMQDSPNGMSYIGIGVNKNTPESESSDSEDPTEYEWSTIGEDIVIYNEDGTFYYIWDKYSDYYGGRDEDNNISMTDDPEGKTFIGLAYYKLTSESASLEASSLPETYTWFGVEEDIEEVSKLWVWLKFATLDVEGNIDAASLSNSPAGKTHKGLAINKDKPASADPNSLDPAFYIWTLLTEGIQLPDGTWVWDKYSDYLGGRDSLGEISMSDDPTDKEFTGLLFNQLVDEPYDLERSENPDLYNWSGFGDITVPIPTFIWIKFATSEFGANISDFPKGKTYMGIGYNKYTNEETTIVSDYFWNPIGELQDYIGFDGQTYYTWVKWADNPTPSASEMYDLPDIEGKFIKWMGLAFRKTADQNVESLDYRDYVWYQFDFEDSTSIESYDQNNRVKVIDIPFDELTELSEQGISDWINSSSTPDIVVEEDVNLLFNITGEVDDDDVEEPLILDNSSLTLTLDSSTDTTATLSWVTTDDAVVRYELRYSILGTEIPVNKALLTTHTLTGLTNNILYSAYVIAYDSENNEKLSNIVEFTLFETDTPNLLLDNRTTTSIQVSWNIDEAFNADNYILTRGGSTIYEGTGLSFNSVGLTAGTEYEFSITAYNLGSASVTTTKTFSTINVAAPLTAPVLSFVSSTSNELTYAISIPSDEFDRVTTLYRRYRIYDPFLDDIANPWSTYKALPSKTIDTLYNLLPNTQYEIQVYSSDGTIVSTNSASLIASTKSDEKAKLVFDDVREPLTYDSAILIYNGEPNTVVTVAFEFGALFAEQSYLIETVEIIETGDTILSSGFNQGTVTNLTFTLDANGEFYSEIDFSDFIPAGTECRLAGTIIASVNGIDPLYKTDILQYYT